MGILSWGWAKPPSSPDPWADPARVCEHAASTSRASTAPAASSRRAVRRLSRGRASTRAAPSPGVDGRVWRAAHTRFRRRTLSRQFQGRPGKVDAFGEPLWTEPVEAAAMGMTADDYAVLRGMTGNRPVRSGGRAYTAPIPAPGAAGDVYASRIAAAEAEAAALRAARGASAAEAGVPIPPPTAGTGAGGRPIFAPSGRVVNLTVTGRVGTGGRGAAPPTTPSAAGPK